MLNVTTQQIKVNNLIHFVQGIGYVKQGRTSIYSINRWVLRVKLLKENAKYVDSV